jgi:hypothetical protein
MPSSSSIQRVCKYQALTSHGSWYRPRPSADPGACGQCSEANSCVIGIVYDEVERLVCSELPVATSTFCGRATELLAIAEALDPARSGQKGIVLYGIGGSGKTQLALRYINQCQQFYSAIIWIDVTTAEHAIQSFDEAADMISSKWPPSDLPITYGGSANWRKVIARLRSTCYPRWLLVIDSVDDLDREDFAQYVPSCQYGSVIVTSTKYRAAEVFRLPPLEIDRLDLDSSRELLLTRASGSISNTKLSEDGRIGATVPV